MNGRNCNCENHEYNHVHELTGSTIIVSENGDCHNHRFCTVTGKAIYSGNSHVHEVTLRTDTADGHSHEFCGKTNAAVSVGNNKHVHYIKDITEREDGHRHQLQAATLIESPTDCE